MRPAAARTMTRTRSFSAAAASASARACIIAAESTLARSGSFRVSRATGPSTSANTRCDGFMGGLLSQTGSERSAGLPVGYALAGAHPLAAGAAPARVVDAAQTVKRRGRVARGAGDRSGGADEKDDCEHDATAHGGPSSAHTAADPLPWEATPRRILSARSR